MKPISISSDVAREIKKIKYSVLESVSKKAIPKT